MALELSSFWVTPRLSVTVLWPVLHSEKYLVWFVQVYGIDAYWTEFIIWSCDLEIILLFM